LEHVAGIAGWLVSAALLLYVAGRVGRRFGETIGDQFWITVAAIVLQIAVVAQVLSPVHQLRPVAFLIVQVIVALIVRLTIKPPAFDRRLFRDHVRLLKATPTRRMLLLVIGLLLLLALAVIIAVPINGFDDRMYRASRAAYWLQHRSLLPWNSQNDRQTAFPFGGELMFFWPILFTRDEVLGRLSFFAGIPLCAAGLYTVMRQLRVSRTVALIGVLILLTTPTFARIEEGLYQEVWMTAFALGAAYFALRSSRDGRYLAWMACFTVMAVNVKTTALALAPAAALVPLLLPGRRSRGLGSVLLGAMAGVMFSGLALTIAMNLQRDHRPLGPAGMTSTHTVDRSATQLRTHAARFVANLIDFPVIPSEPLRQSLSDAGNAWLRLCRADEPLSMEDPANPWPGTFHFGVGRYASRLSLPGDVLVAGPRRRSRRRRAARRELAPPRDPAALRDTHAVRRSPGDQVDGRDGPLLAAGIRPEPARGDVLCATHDAAPSRCDRCGDRAVAGHYDPRGVGPARIREAMVPRVADGVHAERAVPLGAGEDAARVAHARGAARGCARLRPVSSARALR
jgi:hypothetical protein